MVVILVLIASAHLLEVASQELAGNSEPVSPESRNPAPGGQIFVTRKPEQKTQSDSAIILVGEGLKAVF